MLVSKDGKILYCACLIHRGMPKTVHLHADDLAHARAQICLMYRDRSITKIIDIAPVVGVFAEDEDDKKEKVYTLD